MSHSGSQFDEQTITRGVALLFAALLTFSLISGPALAGGLGTTSSAYSYQTQGLDTNWQQEQLAEQILTQVLQNNSTGGNGTDGQNATVDQNTTVSTDTTGLAATYSSSNVAGSVRTLGENPLNQTISVPDVGVNTTAEILINARRSIAELDPQQRRSAYLRNQSLEHINESLSSYRSKAFAESPDAFYAQRQALTRLNQLSWYDVNQTKIQEATDAIRMTSNFSARFALAQALETVKSHKNQLDSIQYATAVLAIHNADMELSLGDQAFAGPLAADHYKRAWQHSHIALDTVENAVDPSLSTSYSPAVETNDSFQTQLRITLDDIRTYKYEQVNLTFANGTQKTLNLSGGYFADGTARAMETIELGPEVTNKTVHISARSMRDPILEPCFTAKQCERTIEKTVELNFTKQDTVLERPDPDEYNEVEVEDGDTGVTVEAGGEGLYRGSISISDQTPKEKRDFHASPVVRVDNLTSFDSAQVTIPVDKTNIQNEENLTIYTWDPSREGGWKPLETTLNASAGTASAEVDHFSFFAIFDPEEWDEEVTSTITLKDRHVKGNLTDIEDQQKDFILTIDTSGSMSGDGIKFARIAGKRFVDALYEDEKGGLVTFDSSAEIQQSLTTDHEKLKQSISDLEADGGTDLAAGIEKSIQIGISQLVAHSSEDRKSELILLADGRTDSGNPLDAARDAAEKDIRINTVGLTDQVNKNRLRKIAKITGGKFYYVEDAEDLPETFERIPRAELVDSDSDGIPDAVADANPFIPQLLASNQILKPISPRINIDPAVPDTSGDGILDNETITVDYRVFEENNKTKLKTKVTSAKHHPAYRDTDGDGVSDKQEIEGWPVVYTDSYESSKQLINKLHSRENPDRGDLQELKEQYGKNKTATSDPMLPITTQAPALGPFNRYPNVNTNDQLTDGEKKKLGLDPGTIDTTTDTIPDAVAVERGLDPTLHDFKPPVINVTSAKADRKELEFGWNPIDMTDTYTVSFRLEDPSGIQSWRITLDGEEYASVDYGSNVQLPVYLFRTEKFEADFLNGIGDSFSGTELKVHTADPHGAKIRGPALTHSGLMGTLAESIDEIPGGAYKAGQYQGLTTGAGETVGGVLGLIFNFKEKLKALTKIDIEALQQLIKNLPEAINHQQQLDNPYIKPENGDEGCGDINYDKCNQFKIGWYKGYIGWMVIEAVAGTKGSTKVVKGLEKLADAGNSKISRIARVALRGKAAKDKAVTTITSPVGSVLRGSYGLGKKGALKLVSGTKTAGQQFRAIRKMKKLDTSKVQSLSSVEKSNFGRYLAKGWSTQRLKRALRVLKDGQCQINSADTIDPAGDCSVDIPDDSPIWKVDNDEVFNRLYKAVENDKLDLSTAERVALENDAYRRTILDAAESDNLDADELGKFVASVENLDSPLLRSDAKVMVGRTDNYLSLIETQDFTYDELASLAGKTGRDGARFANAFDNIDGFASSIRAAEDSIVTIERYPQFVRTSGAPGGKFVSRLTPPVDFEQYYTFAVHGDVDFEELGRFARTSGSDGAAFANQFDDSLQFRDLFEVTDEQFVSGTKIGTFATDTGPDGAKFVQALDKEVVKNVFRLETDSLTRLFKLEGDSATAFRRSLARQYKDTDLSAGEVQQTIQKIDSLEGDKQTRAMRLVEETPDGDSVRFVSEVDSDSLDEFLTTPCGSSSPSSRGTTSDCGVEELPEEKQQQYYKTVSKVSGGNDDINAQKIIDDINQIDNSNRKVRLQRHVLNTGEEGVRFLRDKDPELLKNFFKYGNSDSTPFDRWGDWRQKVTQYDQNVLTDSRTQEHITKVKKIVESDTIEDTNDILDDIADLPTGENKYQRRQFLRYQNEIQRTVRYSEEFDLAPYNKIEAVETVEVEPQFPNTPKDVDARIVYRFENTQNRELYVEFKRLDGEVSGSQIESNLININNKYIEIGDNIQEPKYGELKIKFGDNIGSEQEFRAVLENRIERLRNDPEVNLDIQFDKLRVVPENDDSFTIDMSQYSHGE